MMASSGSAGDTEISLTTGPALRANLPPKYPAEDKPIM